MIDGSPLSAGSGGVNGDLYVSVSLKKHEIFTREGVDLHCTVPISYATVSYTHLRAHETS